MGVQQQELFGYYKYPEKKKKTGPKAGESLAGSGVENPANLFENSKAQTYEVVYTADTTV
jgi:hypothetical protein